jgi:hypothetical protein
MNEFQKSALIQLGVMLVGLAAFGAAMKAWSTRNKFQVGECYAFINERAAEPWEVGDESGTVREIRSVNRVLDVGKEYYLIETRYNNLNEWARTEPFGKKPLTESKHWAHEGEKIDCDTAVDGR